VKALLERLAAAAIIALGLGLALVWVFRMPLFQSPDENAHADYAFTLFTTHAPIRARDMRPATDVHPLVRYLEDASGFRTMRYNQDGRVPAGYGSRSYNRTLDAASPRVPTGFLAQNGGRVPWVARQYGHLYYTLDALAIGIGAMVGGGSALAEFFAARLFNVVLLAITLVLTWLTLVELRLSVFLRLGLLATIAWFPLSRSDQLSLRAEAGAVLADSRVSYWSEPRSRMSRSTSAGSNSQRMRSTTWLNRKWAVEDCPAQLRLRSRHMCVGTKMLSSMQRSP